MRFLDVALYQDFLKLNGDVYFPKTSVATSSGVAA